RAEFPPGLAILDLTARVLDSLLQFGICFHSKDHLQMRHRFLGPAADSAKRSNHFRPKTQIVAAMPQQVDKLADSGPGTRANISEGPNRMATDFHIAIGQCGNKAGDGLLEVAQCVAKSGCGVTADRAVAVS